MTSFAFMTTAAMLVVFPCMDYSSLYFLKNVFTFTTTKINFVSLDLILAIDFFPQNIVRGRFKIKNTIICGKSPKGGGSAPKSKKSTYQM